MRRTEFFVILDHFLPLYPPNNPRNQNFVKIKKLTGDTISLHRCNINDNHMMYGSWDTECHGHNFFIFWMISCPFTPVTTWKMKISKNKKNKKKTRRDIIILYMCIINDNHMMYGSWDTELVINRTFCHFGPFFALLVP